MEIEVKAKKWGDSIGVIIPKEIVEQEKIKPNDKLNIIIAKKADLSRFFGTLKTKKSTQEMKDDARRIWDY